MKQNTVMLIAAVAVTVGCAAFVAAQEPEPTPMPVPVPSEKAPPVPRQQGAPGGMGSMFPDFPHTPMSEKTYESLSPEEKERLRHFREETLPAGSTFEDYVAYWRKPRPYPKTTVVRIDEKHASPHPAVAWKMEIVGEDDENIWLRALPPEDPESPIHQEWLLYEMTQAAWNTRRTMMPQQYYLDFDKAIVPPPSLDSMRFEPRSTGLPTTGRWQMNFVLADMNGDGHADIVAPAPRMGAFGHPVVFLGDGEGGFEYWEESSWDRKVPYDYGGVAAADFNGDGHQDVALAVHFGQQWILYGDGEGAFRNAQRLPSPDSRRTSRAVAAGDVDRDGDVDLAFIAEITYDQTTTQPLQEPTVWVVRNDGEGNWTVDGASFPNYPIGDQVELRDVDGNGLPDVVLASNLNAWRALVYLNRGDDGWERAGFEGVLSEAYHFGVAFLDSAGEAGTELVAGFAHFKDVRGENQARVGLVRYPLADDGLEQKGRALALGDDRNNPFFRVAAGDLNGDGRDDLVAAKKGGAIQVFLQDEEGSLIRERSPEIRPVGRPFHLQIADLDGDGLGDIIGCFAGSEDNVGGIRVWRSLPTS